ncbi:MAG: hypothetical protein NW207_03385 [Cytophagales bacterium]|nr:hypothetical protein [Cytophagales bacterium]
MKTKTAILCSIFLLLINLSALSQNNDKSLGRLITTPQFIYAKKYTLSSLNLTVAGALYVKVKKLIVDKNISITFNNNDTTIKGCPKLYIEYGKIKFKKCFLSNSKNFAIKIDNPYNLRVEFVKKKFKYSFDYGVLQDCK